MKQKVQTAFTILFFMLSSFLYAQPDCVTLISPADGAVDQALSVVINWEAAPTGDVPTMYHVFYGVTSGSLIEIQQTTSTSATISGLTIESTYYWRIEAESANGTTMNCTEYSFMTLGIPQGPVVSCGGGDTPVDFVDDMEDFTSWTGDMGSGTESNKWNVRTGQTPSSNTGPSGAYSGSNYFYYEASGASIDASIVSPMIDLSNVSGIVNFSFHMFAFGSGIHSLEVGVSTSSTGPFTNLWTWEGELQGANNEPWQKVGFDLSSYAGQIIYIEFINVITPSGGSLGDMAIDYMTVNGCELGAPVNDVCSGALELAVNGEPGELLDENTGSGTNSGLGAPGCNTIVGKDLYYSIETDIDGGGIIVDLTSTAGALYTIVLYSSSCGSLVEESCATATATGQDVQLNHYTPGVVSGHNPADSRFVSETFIVRVYDENNVGENFTIGASGTALAALPVTLTLWEAELMGNSVRLSWSTEMEYNSDLFIVQKSSDAIHWNDAKEVIAKGFSDRVSNYYTIDSELSSLQYYRLKMVDFDGRFEVSDIILIEKEVEKVKVYPNPTVEFIQINGFEMTNDLHVSIFDFQGKLITGLTFVSGRIDVSSLNNGLYTIVVKDNNENYVSSFIKIE